MRTVAETSVFIRYAAAIWSDDERTEFVNWIAAHPEAGDLIPGSGGCRKVRWSSKGRGKRGGARIIYFCTDKQVIWLLIAYTKSHLDTLPVSFLAKLRKEIENAI